MVGQGLIRAAEVQYQVKSNSIGLLVDFIVDVVDRGREDDVHCREVLLQRSLYCVVVCKHTNWHSSRLLNSLLRIEGWLIVP